MFREDDPRLQEIMRRAGNIPAHIAASPNVRQSQEVSEYLAQKLRAQRAAANENQRQHLLQQQRMFQDQQAKDQLGLNQQVLDQNKKALGTQRTLNWVGTGVNLAGLAQQYLMDRPAAEKRSAQTLAETLALKKALTENYKKMGMLYDHHLRNMQYGDSLYP